MAELTAAAVARHLEGEVRGDPATLLTGFASAEAAQPGDLTFADSAAFFARAEASGASAVLTSLDAVSAKAVIRVRHPRLAMAKVLSLFYPEPVFVPGIHPSAIVHPGARVEPSAHIGPLCVVDEGTRVGRDAALVAGVVVGEDCEVGEATRVYPNVTIYARTRIGCRVRIHAGAVLGSDGYAYVFDAGAHRKVPQVGHLVIEDDVEIGANVTIDRGALGATVVGRGTKLDNLVHLAHNVTVGAHCLLVAQVGVAGSSQVGDYVTMAGQVGIADHLKIGNRVTIGAQSGVMNHIPDGQKWLGAPARPALQAKRQLVALERLPEMLHRLAELERQVAGLRRDRPPEGS